MPHPSSKPFLLALSLSVLCSPALMPVAASAQTAAVAPASAWPQDQWWLGFRDPALDSLIAEALETNPSLAEAQARLKKAEAQARIAGATQWPSLSANASVISTKQSYNNGFPAAFVPQGYNDAARATLDFSYEFDLWGKTKNQKGAAINQAQATEAELYAARTLIALNLSETYFELARLKAEREATDQVSKGSDRRLLLEDLRVKRGMDTAAVLQSYQSTDADIKTRLLELDAQIAAKKTALAVLLGGTPERAERIADPKLPTAGYLTLPENVPAELLGRRPDIVAARLRVESAAKTIKVAKAAYYPNINLSAYFGAQSLGLGDFSKSGSDIGGIGPAISLPIFAGHALSANLKGAEADYEAARARYQQTLNQALQDVADASMRVKTLTAQSLEAEKSLIAHEKTYHQAKDRYQHGLATLIEVLNDDAAYLQAKVNAEAVQSQRLQAELQLIRALGGGFRFDEATTLSQTPVTDKRL